MIGIDFDHRTALNDFHRQPDGWVKLHPAWAELIADTFPLQYNRTRKEYPIASLFTIDMDFWEFKRWWQDQTLPALPGTVPA